MSSPIPPDPYAALGVSNTADLNAIRLAHRKLVLKHHPDRIRDEAEREKGKSEFQKVQQAYELLSDPNRRSRYDDRIKLAELQKEKMMRDANRPSASRASPPSTTIRREMRADHYFEERAPRDDFFDSRDRYDEPLARGAPRKHDSYERRPSSAPKTSEKKEKAPSKWDRPIAGLSFTTVMRMKEKASQAKDRVARENAQKAEMRDREKRRDRSDKQSSRKAAYVEDEYSGSESDTVVPKYSPRPERTSAPKPRSHPEPEFARRGGPPLRRSGHEYEEERYSDDDKWERHHATSRDYIVESQQKRPTFSRTGSDAYVYWKGDQGGHRRSGSDNDKRPSSSRRTPADEGRPRPTIGVHTSAPDGLRPHVVDREPREPQRSKTAAYPTERPVARDAPSLSRSATMPVSRGSKKENTIPLRSSNLKHGETQPDSGYYSSSNPHTPEMRGESPPSARDLPRENSRRQQSTKYAIVDEAESDDDGPRRHRVTKILDSDEDNRHRQYHSPTSDMRDRDQPRERPRLTKLDTDIRPRTTRAPDSRTSVPRAEFQSSRGSPSVARGKLFHEITPDERSHRYDPAQLKTAPQRDAATASYTNYRTRSPDEDYSPSSRFREDLRGSGRRSSAQYA